MKLIGVSMRVALESAYAERRDAIDQRWIDFLQRCALMPVLLPNNLTAVKVLVSEISFDGFLLTGGNDLKKYGGNVPERDSVERWVIQQAIRRNTPLIGVCRGMQSLQNFFHWPLVRVGGQIQKRQKIQIRGRTRWVNSFHNWGTLKSQPPFDAWANSQTGVIKAITHRKYPLHGVMWHPERLEPFASEDMVWFKKVFRK